MSDLEYDGYWIDSSGLEHEEDNWIQTYDPTQTHFWRQLGHSDATNGVAKRTLNLADFPTGNVPAGQTGTTPPVPSNYQELYNDGYDEGIYDAKILGQDLGTTVEGE